MENAVCFFVFFYNIFLCSLAVHVKCTVCVIPQDCVSRIIAEEGLLAQTKALDLLVRLY